MSLLRLRMAGTFACRSISLATQKTKHTGWVWLRRILIGLAILLVMITGAALALLFSGRVQTWAIAQLAAHLYNKTGFRFHTGKVWLDVRNHTLDLHNLRVIDWQGHEMINAPHLHGRYTQANVLNGGLQLDSLSMYRSTVRIITIEELRTTNITTFVAMMRHWARGNLNDPVKMLDTSRSADPPTLRIREVLVHNNRLIISNLSRDTIPTGIDYNHLQWVGVNGRFQNFRARSDTLEFVSKNLKMRELRSQWPIHNLQVRFRCSRHRLQTDNLNLQAGQSHFRGRGLLHYKQPADLSDFVDKIYCQGSFGHTRLNLADIALIAKPIERFKDVINIDTIVLDGSVSRFRADTFQMQFGRQSIIHGRMKLAGMPKAKPLKLEATISSPALSLQDLHTYLPKSAHKHIDPLGVVELHAWFAGTQKEFNTRANVRGKNFGYATLDGSMDLGASLKTAKYEGDLTTKDFELGKMLGRKLLGKLTVDAHVKGTGLEWETADLAVKANIKELEVIGLPLRRIRIEADLDKNKIWQLITGVKLSPAKVAKKDQKKEEVKEAPKPEEKPKKKKKKFLFF